MAATTDEERDHTSAGPRRSGASVRVRITAAVALLTTLALAGAGTIVYLIEKGRVDQANQDTIQQEFDEFAVLQENGLDAETQQPFADVEALISAYMRRNVPSEFELLVGWWDGQPRIQLPAWDEVTRNPEFVAAVGPLIDSNGSTTLDSDFGMASKRARASSSLINWQIGRIPATCLRRRLPSLRRPTRRLCDRQPAASEPARPDPQTDVRRPAFGPG